MIKFLFAGLLGLSLSLAFPGFPVDWLVIVLAWSGMENGKALSILLAGVLTFFYGAFSLTPYWQILLPLILGLSTFERMQRNFSLGPNWKRGWLMAYLLGLEGLGRFIFSKGADAPQWTSWLWSGVTLLVGNLLLPAIGALLFWGLSSLLLSPRKIGERDFGRVQYQMGRSPQSRRPFGWEKGI